VLRGLSFTGAEGERPDLSANGFIRLPGVRVFHQFQKKCYRNGPRSEAFSHHGRCIGIAINWSNRAASRANNPDSR
jgi:hypothetical protein